VQAFEEQPYNAHLYVGFGQAMQGLKRDREAAVGFDYAVHVDPKFAQAWVYRGDALKALDRLEEAEEVYEEARQLGF
jgi:tetratricopeptide (TPR) repeat protein